MRLTIQKQIEEMMIAEKGYISMILFEHDEWQLEFCVDAERKIYHADAPTLQAAFDDLFRQLFKFNPESNKRS